MTPRAPLVITEPVGGPTLAQAVARGTAPEEWYVRRPRTEAEWSHRTRDVMASSRRDWFSAIAPAMQPSGRAAQRLDAALHGNGVVVTTGQQPGLFGGPIYTWSKALSAIALADELETVIGTPVAPVFWAATDDSDFAEASWTMIAGPGGAEELRMPADSSGSPMSDLPLGDVSALIDRLERGARSAAWPLPLQLVRHAYRPGQTVGGAYLELLRGMLEPLGMAVLDASHAAVRTAGSPLMRDALRKARQIGAALAERDAALESAGHRPQVASVRDLSLVFRAGRGARQRITHAAAAAMAESADDVSLSPNVLLRPLVERAILPTVAYVAGPGEMAYFAQVSAVASALGAATPLAVPRWFCTILEPHVVEILARLELEPGDLRDPYAAETRLAKGYLPDELSRALAQLTGSLDDGLSGIAKAGADLVSPAAVEGARRGISARLVRLERRYTAAMKRRMADVVRDVGTARGSLFPSGKRQERALNLLPLLARYGRPLLSDMRAAAGEHARGLVDAAHVTQPARARTEHPAPSA